MRRRTPLTLVPHQGPPGRDLHADQGRQFSYEVRGDYIWLDRTNRIIPKRDIEEALGIVPLANTVVVRHLQAPSYIYAILMDPRIRMGEW